MPSGQRSGKRKKKDVASDLPSAGARRTQVADGLHMFYSDKEIPLTHLTTKARKMLGDPNATFSAADLAVTPD
jgi:hypothetical protein